MQFAVKNRSEFAQFLTGGRSSFHHTQDYITSLITLQNFHDHDITEIGLNHNPSSVTFSLSSPTYFYVLVSHFLP